MSAIAAPVDAPRIRKLDEVVINKIAAGEVIHRPASALKEMLENSIDAKATRISVVLKDGGLKSLQITDDGCGIRKEDFPLVCERFATSKLQSFDDLQSIATFGFRGEALASITHVARVSIVSMTADQQMAFRASFSDGVLSKDEQGNTLEPQPCAGVRGTTITVEDLFFNVVIRRKAMKSANEEYHRCLDIMLRYSIHFAGISFTCKKAGAGTPDLHTQSGASKLDNIRLSFGSAVGNEVLPLEGRLDTLNCSFSGLCSNANFNMKKFVFILFINNRLVESTSLRSAIDSVYSKYLPKLTHPFVYLALDIAAHSIDVNVHPTKREVQFLHEDEIVQGVQSAVEKLLLGANASRVFYTQQLIAPSTSSSRDADVASIQFDTAVSSPNMEQPSGQIASQSTEDEPEPAAKRSRPAVVSLTSRTPVATAPPETVAKPKYVPSKLVRTDASNPQGRLDSFIMRRPNPSSSTGLPESNNATDAPPSAPAPAANIVRKKADRPPVMLISVHDLIDALERRSSDSLTDVFQQHTFVGCIDDMFALIQCRTKLFLIDVCALSKSFFFEQALRSFSCLPRIELDTAASIDRLVRIALDSPYVPEAADYDAATKSDMAQKAATLLSEKADMLLEYFSIDIRSGNGRVSLVGLPQLLDNYEPPLLNLPLFLLRLATEVNWNDERACFENIAQELALFYQVQPGMYLSPTSASSGGASERISQLVELQLLPQMRFNFSVPSAHSSDGSLVQIACLEQLYKIFERC